MKQYLFCEIFIGDLYQSIIYIDETLKKHQLVGRCELRNLEEQLIRLCYAYKINLIKIKSNGYNIKPLDKENIYIEVI